jgi:restriction endonuclease Mrr
MSQFRFFPLELTFLPAMLCNMKVGDPQFPKYADIEHALVLELGKRGGAASPSDHDQHHRTVYEALADHFQLSVEARDAVVLENGVPRSRWENMVRWAARKLKDQGTLVKGLHGVWKIQA